MRVAIVEDDESSKERLLSYLKRYETETGTKIQAETFTDGIYFAEKYAYDQTFDVVLLDIEMEQLDGMKTAELIRSKDENTVIIFITNMAQYVMEGYKVNAMDFVIKPVSYYMFCEKMKKAGRRIDSRIEKFVVTKNRDEVYRIHTKDILYIEVQNHNLIYHTVSGNYTCIGTMKKTEKELKELAFSRCSASYLVHFSQIARIEKGKIIMNNGDVLPIGKTRYHEFMEALTDYYGGHAQKDV